MTFDDETAATADATDRPRARKSSRGFEIYVPERDTTWIASDLTVPLGDVA